MRTLQLQDVLIIKNGKDYKHFKQGDVPVYGTGGIIAYIDTFVYDKPSVLIPEKGVSTSCIMLTTHFGMWIQFLY